MKTYETPAGQNITTVCKNLAQLATEHNTAVQTIFNDVPIIAHPGILARELVRKWQDEMDQRRIEYRASQEAIQEAMKYQDLEKLLSIHPNIVFQKFAGNRDYPYEIRLGSLNFWAKGTTLSEAIENALKIDPKTIKGVAQ